MTHEENVKAGIYIMSVEIDGKLDFTAQGIFEVQSPAVGLAKRTPRS